MNLADLSWKNPPEVQAEAIRYFSDPSHIDPKELTQLNGKEYWYNAAQCLIAMGYPQIKVPYRGCLTCFGT